MSSTDTSLAWLNNEIEKAEETLSKTEAQLAKSGGGSSRQEPPTLQRLGEMNVTLACLELSHAIAKWNEKSPQSDSVSSNVIYDAGRCVDLGTLLQHQASKNSKLFLKSSSGQQHPNGFSSTFTALFEKEYLPLHKFVRAHLILGLQKLLKNVGYPSPAACSDILRQCSSLPSDLYSANKSIASYVSWLVKLQVQHEATIAATAFGSRSGLTKLDAVVELCRPIVSKVAFHFLEESEDRLTTTRIDRLPEWICAYVREHVFAIEGGSGPWEMIYSGLPQVMEDSDRLVMEFLGEMQDVVASVLIKRDFFRHPTVVGPNSNPIFLCSAVQQLLTFDALLAEVSPALAVVKSKKKGLTSTFVAGDEELWEWWVRRERVSMLALLFDDAELEDTEDETATPSSSSRGLSPRAELFCGLLFSLRAKATVLDDESSASYISKVAVPLCQHFLDAIHETATDLRDLLKQRKLTTQASNLRSNLLLWIEMINGTNLAAARLMHGAATGADHDLARVGRSMERLRDVFVEECSTAFVDTVLMENAKLASYLMRSSHLLMSEEPEALTMDSHHPSSDLQDAISLYKMAMDVCSQSWEEQHDEGDEEMRGIVRFAPNALRINITNRLADKFLEVCLDVQGMTPDLAVEGCKAFAQDVDALMMFKSKTQGPQLPPFAKRLEDVVNLMSMDVKPFQDLKTALGALGAGGLSPVLSFTAFSQDGTLMEEAMSMLRAKGFAWIHLEDAISVLNRRE